MWNRFFEPTDIEDRNQLRAVDAAQLILTGVFFVGAIDLQRFDNLPCNTKAQTWISVMLYGNLFWLFYLGTTLVGRYRSKVVRFFFRVLNYVFYLYHIVMFIWDYMLWTNSNQYLGSFYTNCHDAANFYADCYRYLGYFFAVVLIVGIFATLCSLFRPRENLDASIHFDNTGRTQGVNPNDPFGKGVAGQYGANTYQPIPLVATTGANKPNVPIGFDGKRRTDRARAEPPKPGQQPNGPSNATQNSTIGISPSDAHIGRSTSALAHLRTHNGKQHAGYPTNLF